jgi:hypothetical protein
MLPINDPNIVSEITFLHDAYERALAANDVGALNNAFWVSLDVVRFGVNEHLYGAEAMVAYRAEKPPVLVDRRMLRRTITTFGADAASVMCEISQIVVGQQKHSRQSQTWIRFPELGWKIVAAHVSHALPKVTDADTWAGYVDRTAAAMHLTLEPAHRDGVIQNLHRAAAIAAPLLEFSLPVPAEIAPVFVP